MVLSLVTAAATAPSAHRLVVVVGRPTDPRVTEQHALLAQGAAALRERDVVVQDIAPEAARRERAQLGVRSGTKFQVLLIGKDGGIKLRRDKPVAASEIIALIDTMPMRQEETRRR
jgi:predicted Rossmann fold nucleotide-binding protein DprA/Smf involved in DNA uptake